MRTFIVFLSAIDSKHRVISESYDAVIGESYHFQDRFPLLGGREEVCEC
jgi:hypothetical protein